MLIHKDKLHRAVLSRVVEKGNIFVVRVSLQLAASDIRKGSIINLNVDINATDDDNWTSLDWAVEISNFYIIEMFLGSPYLVLSPAEESLAWKAPPKGI